MASQLEFGEKVDFLELFIKFEKKILTFNLEPNKKSVRFVSCSENRVSTRYKTMLNSRVALNKC